MCDGRLGPSSGPVVTRGASALRVVTAHFRPGPCPLTRPHAGSLGGVRMHEAKDPGSSASKASEPLANPFYFRTLKKAGLPHMARSEGVWWHFWLP